MKPFGIVVDLAQWETEREGAVVEFCFISSSRNSFKNHLIQHSEEDMKQNACHDVVHKSFLTRH